MSFLKYHCSFNKALAILSFLLMVGCRSQSSELIVSFDAENPQVRFAISELKASFAEKGFKLIEGAMKKADIIVDVQHDLELIQILNYYFPESDANRLFTACQEASMIYPVTTGFHWGAADYMWYIEGCKSRPRFTPNETGFHDVNHFINLPPHKYSGAQSIPDYVQMQIAGGSTELNTPFQVAEMLHGHANRALDIIENMDPGDNSKLAATLHDIKTVAALGKYYGYKIEGSTYRALFRGTKDQEDQQAAINALENALVAWKQYTGLALQQNINPIWTNRVGHVDRVKTTEWAENDIRIAKEE